ncbi:amidase [Hufsiella ginkgonis]|uniref:Amidase n=1 Tax=Hufsiella ginkgonis TaxID=2695274 RepID=A0A7K1XUZ9_9SPHI|nr:amidase [Hufsiella ginkgonis]MXV14627.1 amidase [Hufsiella ginkgonis]
MKITLKKSLYLLVPCGVSFLAGSLLAGRPDPDTLTVSIVSEAAKVTGIPFTGAEADSMLGSLNDQRNAYAELHALKMSNAISPSLSFNPMPPGYRFPDKLDNFKLAPAAAVTLPANRDALAFYTVRQLGELVRTRKISSLKLTRFFIARLKKYQPQLLFAVTITEELALKQAAAADAAIAAGKYRGPLHGIPFGAKDLLAAKGYKTTWGSVAYKDQEINEDATVIKRLEDAGAVLVAKTTLGELAQGDVWFGGRTKNPWNVTRGSSGSSAGTSSAVSAGCIPFGIGSETLGSIVSPSTECGVTGLRPTFGRVPKTGAMALSWTMDKLGPIARSVEDCALVFNVIKGTDGQDLSAIDAPFDYKPFTTLKGLKIGYIQADFGARNRNRANDSLTLAKLKELGAELVPIELPALPYGAMRIMLTAEAGSAFQELVLSNRDDLLVRQNKGAWPNTFRAAQLIPATEYINASRARTLLIRQLNDKIKGLDLYMAPTSSNNLTATNLSGHPCVVLKNGLNRQELPASITFIGQLFGEGKLLAVAQLYQEKTDFYKKNPVLSYQ